MRRLQLDNASLAQQFRRMVFNVIARNQDDHTKNIAFLMDENGQWRLSPAFDITYSHNPHGKWTNRHQMSLNGKRDDFTIHDLLAVAKSQDIHNASEIIEQISDAVSNWPAFANDAGIDNALKDKIGQYHRNIK